MQPPRILLERERYIDAISRTYYAIFHAAKALLLKKGSDPKNRSGTSSEPGKLYRDELGKEMTREFSKIQGKRERADYGELRQIDRNEVEKDVQTAEKFISKARQILE